MPQSGGYTVVHLEYLIIGEFFFVFHCLKWPARGGGPADDERPNEGVWYVSWEQSIVLRTRVRVRFWSGEGLCPFPDKMREFYPW